MTAEGWELEHAVAAQRTRVRLLGQRSDRLIAVSPQIARIRGYSGGIPTGGSQFEFTPCAFRIAPAELGPQG